MRKKYKKICDIFEFLCQFSFRTHWILNIMSGWLWKKPATPQQEVNNINVDHLPEELRPKQPDFNALGLNDLNKAKDLRNQLSAHQQNAGQGGQWRRVETGRLRLVYLHAAPARVLAQFGTLSAKNPNVQNLSPGLKARPLNHDYSVSKNSSSFF